MDTDVFTAFNEPQKEGIATNEHTRTSPVQHMQWQRPPSEPNCHPKQNVYSAQKSTRIFGFVQTWTLW